jgi:hypothetical protein
MEQFYFNTATTIGATGITKRKLHCDIKINQQYRLCYHENLLVLLLSMYHFDQMSL